MNQEINAYRELNISEMNQKELIVFLYDSALECLGRSKEMITTNKIGPLHEELSRARNIFVHLLATLNMEAGGEFAQKLSTLYAFFIEKITIANATRETKEIDEIVPLISDIRESWSQITLDDSQMPKPPINTTQTFQTISVEV